MQIIQCKVKKVEPLTNNVYKVVLIPNTSLDFKAGQYLQVIMGEEDKRPFSIANAPNESGVVELHIGAEPGNQYAGQVIEKIKKEGLIEVQGGLGNAYVRSEILQPTILLAGGTGFSYTYSILQQLLKNGLKAPLTLFWGTRHFEDMYAFNELKRLEEEHPHFTFAPVIEFPHSDWQGLTGWVHKAVLSENINMENYQVYVAGRFEMAKTVREDFCKQGLPLEHLYGDAYAFI